MEKIAKQIRCTLLFLNNRKKISPQPYYVENLGIQYIGGALRNANINVEIINADYRNLEISEVVELILENRTNVLGIAPCYINMDDAINISQRIKAVIPGIKVCLGGHHATFCCDEILKNEPSFDFVVRGEGETIILELVTVLEEFLGEKFPPIESLLSIKGLSFRYDGKVFHNAPREIMEYIDKIPFPVRDPLDEAIEHGHHAMALICTSRGCPANCSFCSTPKFYGRRWRARSAKNVADEIQMIIERYGLTQFYLTDDQFAGAGQDGRNHVQELISEIKNRELHKTYNLHFFLMVRADFFRKSNEYLIKQFPEVGFMDVFIGFESGDAENIKIYTKGSTQQQYYESIKLLRKYNIFVEGGFIISHSNFLC